MLYAGKTVKNIPSSLFAAEVFGFSVENFLMSFTPPPFHV